jgi:hypothetical protein
MHSLGSKPVVFNHAIANVNYPSGVPGDTGVMRHQDNSDALLLIELLKCLQDFLTGMRVEIAGRLVRKKN